MLEDKRQDLRHVPVTADTPQEMALQPPERLGHLDERRAVAQSTGLALDHGEIILS
jgi:hypothetical protein